MKAISLFKNGAYAVYVGNIGWKSACLCPFDWLLADTCNNKCRV